MASANSLNDESTKLLSGNRASIKLKESIPPATEINKDTYSRVNILHRGYQRVENIDIIIDPPVQEPSTIQSYYSKLSRNALFLIGTILIITTIVLFYYLSIFHSELSSPPQYAVIVDHATGETKVIDNSSSGSKSDEVVLASGTYQRNYNQNGWNYLSIKTESIKSIHPPKASSSNHDSKKSRSLSHHEHYKSEREFYAENYFKSMNALGYLEGHLTCHQMNEWYVNFYSGLFDGGDPTDSALEFLQSNHDWMVTEAQDKWRDSDYWLAVKGLLSQLEGIVQGAKDSCPGTEKNSKLGTYLPSLQKSPELIHLLLMNANGDLYQIAEKYEQIESPPSKSLEDFPDDDDYFYENHIHRPTKPPTSDTSTLSSKQSSNNGKNHKMQQDEVTEQHAEGSSQKTQTKAKRPKKPIPSDNTHKQSGGKYWNIRNVAVTANDNNSILFRIKNYFTGLISNYHKQTLRSNVNNLPKDDSNDAESDLSVNNSNNERVLNENENNHGYEESISMRRPDHCSAMIKLLPDKRDILFGHNTWDDFQCAGPRIFKHYSYDLMSEGMPSTRFDTYFSSSPGLLTSMDDFHASIVGFGHLAVMETTIDVYNPDLLHLIQPQSMLSWIRCRLANQLANSGEEWAQVFSTLHSGTYVNQWMVMDMQKFTVGKNPLRGFLTVLEEVPGHVHSEDMTEHLVEHGYWASYNNPYFEEISILSGNDELCRADANACHDTDPRGLMFKKYHSEVLGVSDLMRLLAYNDWKHDPLSNNDACQAIACRSDLEMPDNYPVPFGAIDAKVSSARMIMNARNGRKMSEDNNNNGNRNVRDDISNTGDGDLQLAEFQLKEESNQKEAEEYGFKTSDLRNIYDNNDYDNHDNLPRILARMGPTSDQQPPFCWKEWDKKRNRRNQRYFHLGQPECFDYKWELFPPPASK
eukprot:gene9997-13449_t